MFEVRWFCFSLTSLLMVVGVACRKNSSLAEPVVVMTGLLKKGRQSRLGQRRLKAIERTYGASLVTTALKNIDSRRMGAPARFFEPSRSIDVAGASGSRIQVLALG